MLSSPEAALVIPGWCLWPSRAIDWEGNWLDAP